MEIVRASLAVSTEVTTRWGWMVRFPNVNTHTFAEVREKVIGISHFFDP